MTARTLALLVVLAVALAGCGTPGGSSGDNAKKAEQSKKNSAKIDVAKAGNVTLTVWDQEVRGGQAKQIKRLNQAFQSTYPNVKLKRVAKSFTNLKTTLKLAVSGSKAPDVVEANQGRPDMGQMVKGGLLKPLDTYADAYGWKDRWSKTLLDLNRFSADGKTFGSGNLYGVAQFGQSTGLFYNKAKLKQYGVDPSKLPTTFAAFQTMLATVAAKAKGKDTVLVIGNKDGYEALHAWGMIQGAYTPAQAVRDWIFHKSGATFDNPTNTQSLNTLMKWVKAGYFGSDYNAVNENDASAAFAKGKGVFYMGGNWQAQVIQAGLKSDAGFMNMPAGASGKVAAIGATSLPWHVSAKSKYPDVDAALINYLVAAPTAAKLMYGQNQIPAVLNAPAASGNPYLTSIANGWQGLVKANGLTLFPDWASDTMLTTMGTNFQKMMAGRQSVADTTKAIQADWVKFDKTLK